MPWRFFTLSRKQNFIFFTLAAMVSIALRTAMLFFTIDTESGFLKTEYLFFGGAILAIIILAALLTFVFSYFTYIGGLSPWQKSSSKRNPNV